MTMKAEDQAVVRQLSGNEVCADCPTRQPQWASVTFGTLHCLECSGAHRGLGVHISFVRSMTMDSWSEKQVTMMRLGGNAQLNDFLKGYGVASDASISVKYGSAAAQLYKDRLVAKVENKPLPTELPKQKNRVSTVYDSASGSSTTSAGGFGSSHSSVEPLSGESESAYVARQRALQEEARARMRAKFGGGGLGGVGSNSDYDAATGSYGGPPQSLDETVEAISGGLRKLGTSVQGLGETEAVQKTKGAVKDLWGATVRGVSSLREQDEGWGQTLRGFGATLSSRVGQVAKNLAAPDDGDAFDSMLREVGRENAGAKKMDGLGSSASSVQHQDASIDDLLSRGRPAASSVRESSYGSDPLPVAPRPPRTASDPPKPPPKPAEAEKDFFASFGV